jgi:hypothetical protein
VNIDQFVRRAGALIGAGGDEGISPKVCRTDAHGRHLWTDSRAERHTPSPPGPRRLLGTDPPVAIGVEFAE